MNVLPATIVLLKTNGNLTLVSAKVEEYLFQVIVIGSSENTDYLREGKDINLLFNESEVILDRGDPWRPCIPNRFPCRITSWKHGAVFSHLTLEFAGHPIAALVPTLSCPETEFQEKKEVAIYLRVNDIFLEARGEAGS